jgi:predicted ATP-dependent endonuclease of OLD family
MKLITARVQNFRSIEDTGEFDINDLTCLVGKNEAGKTAILQALEAQLPYSDAANGGYDITRDYPRRFVTQFEQRHPSGEAVVCTTQWELTDGDRNGIGEEFGKDSVTGNNVTITSGYGFKGTRWTLPIDQKKALEFLLSKFKLDASERNVLNKATDSTELHTILNGLQRTDKQESLFQHIGKYTSTSILKKIIAILSPRTPKFLYVSHYDRMSGQISVEDLIQKKTNKRSSKEDEIFLSLLNLAGTSLEDLKDSTKYEELKAKCEAASNSISGQIFQYWSQNDALEVQIDFSPGRANDPAPFNSGTVVRARVWNGNHRASVPFSERSAGFVWFFSFLVKFAEIRNDLGDVIILLDEPGLTLHGKAQSDLLQYIEHELLPHHQVIFSTHSPFLVPAHRLADVKVVEDVLERKKGQNRPIVHGTKVLKDVLETDKDTLFPLQGALGYDLCQSLFVGKYTLLVEGPSDILYLQILSSALKKGGRISLDARWTLCPSGGIDKMQTFISLFAGNHLNVAVLSDQGNADKSKIERLKRNDILKAGWVYSIADFIGQAEGDIEDLFDPELFVQIINEAFGLKDANKLDVAKLDSADKNTTRLVKKCEAAFRVMTADAPKFDHFTPAEWLLKNTGIFDTKTDSVLKTLERAEAVFKAFNNLLE